MILPPRVAPGSTIGVVSVATPPETRGAVERHIIHLEQAGKLDGAVGVLVGELPYSEWGEGLGPDWPRKRTIDDVLDARLGKLGVPVLYGLPVGHGAEMVTLPLGVEATLDADACTLSIDAPALVAS
jgi:muramoyltetrapeptide carboxypeptidase